MLGVRRFQGHQIDIWQGNPREFHVDFLFECTHFNETDLVNAITSQSGRHIGVFFNVTRHNPQSDIDKTATELFAAIKAMFQQNSKSLQRPAGLQASNRRRITVIADSDRVYDGLQKALFETFEDL